MTAFTIVTIEPQGYVHCRAFDEIRIVLYHSLCDLGHSVSLRSNRLHDGGQLIVLGAHLLNGEDLDSLPQGAIIFNTEQLSGDYTAWTQKILHLAQRFRIWDYASANLRFIRERLADQASLNRLQLGYHPALQKFARRPAEGPDRAFVFFGSVTPYRQRLFDAIELSDRLQINAYFSVYGWLRDQILATCAAALNFHSQSSRILEWPRLVHLIANQVPCIALLHPETVHEDAQLSYLLACDEQAPLAQLQAYYSDPQALQQHAGAAWERFQAERQVDYTLAALDQSLAEGWLPATTAATYGWQLAAEEHEIDAPWYAEIYPWVYSDPRPVSLFHQQEGRYRQYQPRLPSPLPFRPPLVLPPIDQQAASAAAADPAANPGHRLSAKPSAPTGDALLPPLRCAVVLHLHMLGAARQFFALFGRFLGWADFYVTTSDPLLVLAIKEIGREQGIEKMMVRLIDNLGRDIPSKYMVFNQELQAYDLCLFSHGKQSDQHWFYDHNKILAGSPQRIKAILSCFASDSSLGLLFPDYLESLLPSIGWGSMRAKVDGLLERFGCDTAPVTLLEFPAGGFYWARPRALTVLHSLDLAWSDLPPEPLPVDGTLLHTLERMPCLSCEMMGLRWEKIAR